MSESPAGSLWGSDLTAVVQWQRELKKPEHGFCMARSKGVTFQFSQNVPQGGESVPAERRELHIKGATIFIEVSDPAEFSKVMDEFKLSGREIGIRIHAEVKSSMPGMPTHISG